MSGLSGELMEHEFNLMKAQQDKSDEKIAYGVEYKNNYQHIIDIREKSLRIGKKKRCQLESEKVTEDAIKLNSTISTNIDKGQPCDINIGTFIDETDGSTVLTDLSIIREEIKIFKNGSGFESKNNVGCASCNDNGTYSVSLDSNDTDVEGILTVVVNKRGALPICHQFNVVSYYECSGCGNKDITVDRNMFDGQCAECTDISLNDPGFNSQAIFRNKQLIRDGK